MPIQAATGFDRNGTTPSTRIVRLGAMAQLTNTHTPVKPDYPEEDSSEKSGRIIVGRQRPWTYTSGLYV